MLGIGKSNPTVPTDRDGWAQMSEVCRALLRHHNLELSPEQVKTACAEYGRRELMWGDRGIRLRRKPNQRQRVSPPDILYHATTKAQAALMEGKKHLTRDNRRTLYFSIRESHAWRVAHRLGPDPMVLYVDASRASRHGVRFKKSPKNGLFMAQQVPTIDILNLQKNFGHQLSAGGFPIRHDEDGLTRIALIQVKRRSGVSWEVAKGKLEPGETPEMSACRETAEEMGIPNTFTVKKYLDEVRYGFMAPGRLPRLKTVFLYLLESSEPIGSFTPAHNEGIQAVDWFTPEEAERLVKHTSLRPVMKKLTRVIKQLKHEP